MSTLRLDRNLFNQIGRKKHKKRTKLEHKKKLRILAMKIWAFVQPVISYSMLKSIRDHFLA